MSPQVPPRAARAVDGVLELTVAGSFTALGYRARSRLYGWSPPEPGAMAGRTVLVTGATSGLGLAAATELASLGARTIVLGRDAARTEAAAQRIAAGTGNDAVEPVVADLADLSAVAAVQPRTDLPGSAPAAVGAPTVVEGEPSQVAKAAPGATTPPVTGEASRPKRSSSTRLVLASEVASSCAGA